jgi:type IV fimbrial biogenesis protein FimT
MARAPANAARAAHAARGFTLIEAMVVVAIVAVMAALGAPAFRSAIGTMNSKSTAFELVGDLAFARSEAIKRNQPIRMEPKAAGDWSKGWCVVAGTAGAACAASAGKTVLRERGALASALSIGAAPATLDFRPNGRAADDTVDGNLAWSISSSISGVTARCVVITPTGSARSKYGACS